MQEIIQIDIDELVPYERNAKIHSDYQVDLISKSIKEFGFINPILIDENKNVIAGHGRIEAAKSLDYKKLPAIIISGLSEIQRRAYILADNRLSELAEWDNRLVATELKELRESNFDTNLTGFLYDDIDFSFLDADGDLKNSKQKKSEKSQYCECPRCKCVFKKDEILKHGYSIEEAEKP